MENKPSRSQLALWSALDQLTNPPRRGIKPFEEQYLNHGISLNFKAGPDQLTPFELVIANWIEHEIHPENHIFGKIIRLLVKNGANPFTNDEIFKKTNLLQDMIIISVIVKAPNFLDIVDEDGNNIFHRYIKQYSTSILGSLDTIPKKRWTHLLNQSNHDGQTPLTIFADTQPSANNHSCFLSFILKSGVDLHIPNSVGKMLDEIILENSKPPTVLEDNGNDVRFILNTLKKSVAIHQENTLLDKTDPPKNKVKKGMRL